MRSSSPRKGELPRVRANRPNSRFFIARPQISLPLSPSNLPRLRYPSFAQRLGAWLIDSLFVLALFWFVLKFIADGLWHDGLAAASLWFYFPYMESSCYQATLGKYLMGTIVSDELGQRLSFLRAVGRHFSRCFILIFTCGLGLLLAAFNRKRMALHDLTSGTVVIKF